MRSSHRTSRCATSAGATARFNPRYAARYREYRYTVWNGPRSPLHERTALGVRVPLDTAAMARAGSAFIGRHDFSAFGATDRSPVRTVRMVRVRREGRFVTIDVRADSFLRGMVRRMVAVLLEVGLGKMDETAVRAAFAGPGPAFDGAAVPAKGLCLRRVALGRRAHRTERRTRGTMNAKTYIGTRERDRSTMVRRRREGRDPRSARLADRARPRGQAQAHLPAQPGLRRPRDRAQRGQDRGHQRQAREQAVQPPQRLSRRASSRRPWATSSHAGPKKSSGAPSRGCFPTTVSAPSSCAS